MTSEQPLLILKYRWWKVLWRLFWMGFITLPICYMVAFKWAPSSTGLKFWVGEIICLPLIVVAPYFIFEMLLCKEIALYKNEIVKSWYLFGHRRMKLSDAGLAGGRWGGVGKYFNQVQQKRIFHLKTNVVLRGIKGVLIDENLLCYQDIDKLNEILSKVSNRKKSEFEGRQIQINPLISQ